MYLKSLLHWVLAITLPLVLLLYIFKLYGVDLRIPLNYSGDALVHYNFAKNIQTSGWWITNARLGLPLGQQLHDFPLSENLHLLLIKLLILFGLNWITSVNVFYVLTFPLTVVIALYVFRKLGISSLTGLVLSLVYCFLPYHLYRGINHLFLAAYFIVPLAILLAVQISKKDLASYKKYLVFSALIGSIGAYYTYFSIILMLIAFIFGILTIRGIDKNYILKVFGLITFTIAVFVINLFPTFFYNHKYGENPNAVVRSPHETDVYGLRISQLIMPVEEHNHPLLKKIRIKYNGYGLPDVINETQFASLGMITSIGFLALLFFGLFSRELESKLNFDVEKATIIRILSVFTLGLLFLTTLGSFGLLISVFFNPVFRSVNRISIYIAFIALVCLGIFLDHFFRNQKVKLLLVILIPFVLYDQISPAVMQNFANSKEEFESYQNFVSQMEHVLDYDASVFSLPFSQYPEGTDKNLMRIALLSNKLKFSTGMSKWRSANTWQFNIVNLPTQEMLTKITQEGFIGLLIYIPDFPSDKLPEIQSLLAVSPIVDSSNEYVFYSLEDFKSRNEIGVNKSELFYSIVGNCLNNYAGTINISLKHWCFGKHYLVGENVSSETISKRVDLNISLPSGETRDYIQYINFKPGVTKVDITSISGESSGVFQKPYDEIFWPSYLGYPTVIINEVKIEDIK